MSPTRAVDLPSELALPIGILASYLFFLLRRPVSGSNAHYLHRRIRGMQSLAPMLQDSGIAGLKQVADVLNRLEPANFARVARQLNFQLALLQQPSSVPRHYVFADQAPPKWPFADARRLLLILGPAIGIGDEMILYPLPAWMREHYPNLEVSVLSGYEGLWKGVRGVDRLQYYATHAELVEALRGGRDGQFDVVLFADFEKPGLVPSMCYETAIRAYVELSLGAQCVTAVDRPAGRIYGTSIPLEARVNYYEAMDWLVEWLGISPGRCARFGEVMEQPRKDPSGPLRVFVSPFTSKYDPSLPYWSRLLAGLGRGGAYGRDLEFHLDAGAGLTTERFASALLRSVAADRAPGVQFRLTCDPGSRTLSLSGVFRELETAEAVLCADSFAAHAGPLFGCATMVIARAGLENWRTPYARSFYFDLEQPFEEMLAAMRGILARLAGGPSSGALPFAVDSTALHAATRQMKEWLEQQTGAYSTLDGAYDRFAVTYDSVIGNLAQWPNEWAGLLRDVDYRTTWQTPGGRVRGTDGASIRHLRTQLDRWENTNLRKFLRLACGPEVR